MLRFSGCAGHLFRGDLRPRAAAVCLVIAGMLALGASTASATDVITQNWESGLGTWAVTGDLGHVQTNPQTISVKNPEINPTLVTLPDAGSLPSAFSGTNAAWFGDPTSGTFCGGYTLVTQSVKNGCTSDRAYAGTLESPNFSLVGATSAIVHFRSWWEIEGVAASGFDLMKVEYSTDGGTNWTSAGQLNPGSNSAGAQDQSYSNNGLGTSPSWKEYLVDLTPAIGQANVKVRFSFDTVDSLYQGFRGWLLDDIRVATPYDAAAPAISSVESCANQQTAPVTVIHGSNFVLGSTILLDGSPVDGATPSSDRLELPAVADGNHTVQVRSPNGALSNVVSFTAGNCAPPPPPPPTPPKHPTATAVSCTYVFATFTDTCTATVGDAAAPPRTTPTGNVTFASSAGGIFIAGNACNLSPTPLSPGVASCSVQFQPPSASTPTISGSYSGDGGHAPSSGVTSFLIASLPPGFFSGLNFSPSSFYPNPSGASFSRKKFGTTMRFTLKAPAIVTFTVQRPSAGRKVKHGKKTTCDRPNAKNRKNGKCTRYVSLKGSFRLTGKAGANKFTWRGRIGGKTLKPGAYRLVGIPSVGKAKGPSVSAKFRIKKP